VLIAISLYIHEAINAVRIVMQHQYNFSQIKKAKQNTD